MKNFCTRATITVADKNYTNLLIAFSLSLNFLAGITFSLYAPSLPAIATYFSASISAAKNIVTMSLFGFAIGCIVFGTLLDIFGRRPIILLGLLVYTVASFLALCCGSIQELLLVQFIQGFAVGSLSVGCRTIIIDQFTGHQFKVAMLYTTLAFSSGPIIAPFIGGILQYQFGWKANFITYGLVSLVLMILFALLISESKTTFAKFSFKSMLLNYIDVLRHRSFFPGTVIGGLAQLQLLIYTVTGAFLVENVLHRSAIIYGNSALVISCGYLFGTLINRFLIKNFPIVRLIYSGFALLFLGVLLQILFALLGQFNLFTIILPLTLIGFSQGFIFINVMTCCLRLSNNAGITTALFIAAVMLINTLGTNIVSHINITGLSSLAAIFAVSSVIQLIVFMGLFKNVAREIP